MKAFNISFDIQSFVFSVQMSNFLKGKWIENLNNCVRMSFMDVRKGWFNIYEDNWAIYQISKLKKFIETVKFIMQVKHWINVSGNQNVLKSDLEKSWIYPIWC